MAGKADIEYRDDLFHLKSTHRIEPPAPEEVLDPRREIHAQLDCGNTIPVCKRISAFVRHTIRRGCPHSHPGENHEIHPLESEPTGMDTAKRLKKQARQFRKIRKLKK